MTRSLLGGREVIWFSERDGFAHLYRYDVASGWLVNRITAGEWVVRDVVHVDEEAAEVLVTASGREPGENPCHPQLCRASLSGGAIERLTPEDAAHEVSFAPDGRVFVDSHSRADRAPVAVPRDRDGRLIQELERADASALAAHGWRAPAEVTVKAADGTMDLYGLIDLPDDFDPGKRYLVVQSVYAGPQRLAASVRFGPASLRQSLAALGFVVAAVNGRGGPYRSKSFLDKSNGPLQDCFFVEDQAAALQSLAATCPYLDLTRVGTLGASAGGAVAVQALIKRPDLDRAAVAVAGAHDLRSNPWIWGEVYNAMAEDPEHDAHLTDVAQARRLGGKLLLAEAALDRIAGPTQGARLADALTRADKNFEFIRALSDAHATIGRHIHITRRAFRFLARHLSAMHA